MDLRCPPQLVSLLSESSYPVPGLPESSESDKGQPQGDGRSITEQATSVPHSACNTQTTQQAEMTAVNTDAAELSTTGQAPKRRGRPRKTPDNSGALTPKEVCENILSGCTGFPRKLSEAHLPQRRRMQLLNAQRAYQSRKEVTISSQKDRILKLEAMVMEMTSLVESLGEQVAQADVPALPPHLSTSLRSTVAACASMAKEAGLSKSEGLPHPPEPRVQHASPFPLQGNPGVLLSPKSPLQVTPPFGPNPSRPLQNYRPLQPLATFSNNSCSRPSSNTALPVELTTFMSQLRLACAHNAFMTLSDASVSLDSIRSKFRFLLSLMSREHLTAYYKASLQARLDRSALDPWEAVPLHGLGGAGSHYTTRPPLIPREDGGEEDPDHPGWPVVSDPLFNFTAEIRQNLDDTWFDVHDLEAYLKEQDVRLVTHSPSTPQHEASRTCIDVAKLSQGV